MFRPANFDTSQTFQDFFRVSLSQIRYELIYYVLLKVTINPTELSTLKEAILIEKGDRLIGTVEQEHLFELMDQLVA